MDAAVELQLLKHEVKGLLELFNGLDPHGGATRNEEWPLQLRGAPDATDEVCARLNRLKELIKG
jgi:hypothetical protein